MTQRLGIVAVILAGILPITARAAWGPLGAGFCGHCQLPFNSCGCAQPVCGGCQHAPSQCTCAAAPVTSTVLRPVVRTEMRPQATLVNVPVQVTKQVTVDEGSYQQVWVPRMVTRPVTETIVQQQVQYRNVPVQVVQQVPVTITQPVAVNSCGVHAALPGIGQIVAVPYGAPAVIARAPASVPNQHEHPHQHSQQAAQPIAPQAEARVAEQPGDWQKVPVAKGAAPRVIEQQSFEIRELVAPVTAPAAAPVGGVPSAIAAWRAQSHLR